MLLWGLLWYLRLSVSTMCQQCKRPMLVLTSVQLFIGMRVLHILMHFLVRIGCLGCCTWGCKKREFKGSYGPSRKAAFSAHVLPCSPCSRGPEHRLQNSDKRKKKAFFADILGYASIPHLLKPHLWHSKFQGVSHKRGVVAERF